MNNATNARPRFTAPAGKSGSRTLLTANLAQDKASREALKQADMLAFLAAGGLQEPTTVETPEVLMQLEIASLFDAHSWGEYAGATL